jgi:lipopolysaccharide export system permease protein
MKDIVDEQILIINASEIEDDFIVDVFISIFDKNYQLIKNLKSKKVNISSKNWILKDATIYEDYESKIYDEIILKSNFDSRMVRSLYSNLSSLSIFKLIELKKNYRKLNYSTTEIDIQIYKIFTYPLYMVLITILSASIMFNTKRFKSSTFKITLGLFLSVIIYYLNNFFNVMGNTEKIPILFSIWTPLILIAFSNLIMANKINEK